MMDFQFVDFFIRIVLAWMVPWAREDNDETRELVAALFLSLMLVSVISAVMLYYHVGLVAAVIALAPVLAVVAASALFMTILFAAFVRFGLC